MQERDEHDEQLRDRFHRAARRGRCFAEIDFTIVKGKTEPEVVYAIMGRHDLAQQSAFQKTRDLILHMLASYRARRWDEASEVLTLCRTAGAEFGLDRLFDLYASRIRAFSQDPPPVNWDGAYALTEK